MGMLTYFKRGLAELLTSRVRLGEFTIGDVSRGTIGDKSDPGKFASSRGSH